MLSLTGVLTALPTLPAWTGWLGIGASAAFAIGWAVSAKKRKMPEGESAFLEQLDKMEDRGTVIFRRKDCMPIWLSGGVSKLLDVRLTELQEDVTRLNRRFQAENPWDAYTAWDGSTGKDVLLPREDGKQIRLAFSRSGDGRYDCLMFWDDSAAVNQIDKMQTRIDRLEEASRSRTGFFSRMSHEIRTPMNGIVGMLTLAEGKLEPEHPAMEYLRRADGLSDHMLSLLNDILDISRIEANKVELESKPVSIHQLGDLLLQMYQKQLEAKGVAYHVQYVDMTVDRVLGDEMRLRQIIINLLSNSVKFTAEGEITLTFRQMMLQGNMVDLTIRVHDTGVGMSQSFLRKIFQPFEQESIETSHRYGGTGLGMAITEQLVHLMGGQILVESTPGQGSDFTVFLRLPLATDRDEAVKPQETEEDIADPYKNRRILLAEDNETNAMIARELLQDMGATVEVAENGRVAVDKFQSHEAGYFDYILMDVQMPVLDGRAAAREIRALDRPDGKTIPIFAMSADAFVEDQRLSAQSGMDGHFAKPVDYKDMRVKIGRFLKERERTE